MVWIPLLSFVSFRINSVSCICLSFWFLQCLYHVRLHSGAAAFLAATWLTWSGVHRSRRKAAMLYVFGHAASAVIAIKEPPQGVVRLLEGSATALCQRMNCWSWRPEKLRDLCYVLTRTYGVFFHILTIKSLLKLVLPFCFIQKDSLFIATFFVSCLLTSWILTAVFAVEEGLERSDKFDLLSPNRLSESQFPANLRMQSWSSNFPERTNIQHKTDDTLILM